MFDGGQSIMNQIPKTLSIIALWSFNLEVGIKKENVPYSNLDFHCQYASVYAINKADLSWFIDYGQITFPNSRPAGLLFCLPADPFSPKPAATIAGCVDL